MHPGIGQGLLGAVGLPLSGALDLLSAVSTGLAASAGVSQHAALVRAARPPGDAPHKQPVARALQMLQQLSNTSDSLMPAVAAASPLPNCQGFWNVLIAPQATLQHTLHMYAAGVPSTLSLSALIQTLASNKPLRTSAVSPVSVSNRWPQGGIEQEGSGPAVVAYCPAAHAALHSRTVDAASDPDQEQAQVTIVAAPVLVLVMGALVVLQSGGLEVAATLDLHGGHRRFQVYLACAC